MPAEQVAIPEAEALELVSVGGIEAAKISLELLRLEQAGLQLTERREERVGKATEPRRPAEAVQRRSSECAADDESTLGVTHDGPTPAPGEREPPEHVVEGSDRAGEKRPDPSQEIPLDPLDIRRVRHDQDGITLDLLQVAREETCNLAGLGRSDDERETHQIILVRVSDDSRNSQDGLCGKSGDRGGRG